MSWLSPLETTLTNGTDFNERTGRKRRQILAEALRKLAQAKHLSLSEEIFLKPLPVNVSWWNKPEKNPHGREGKRRHLRPSRANRIHPNVQNLESLEPTIRFQVGCSHTLLRSGMSDRTHLCLEALEKSCLPNEERIRHIRAERWISYARAEEVLVRMSELLEYPPRDRMPCLLLYGSTGMGKSKILRKFLRDHPSEPGRRKSNPRHPIISLQMPPEPDERSLYEEILSFLRVPVRSVSTSHLRPIVRDMLAMSAYACSL
jgi:hypothetical protein